MSPAPHFLLLIASQGLIATSLLGVTASAQSLRPTYLAMDTESAPVHQLNTAPIRIDPLQSDPATSDPTAINSHEPRAVSSGGFPALRSRSATGEHPTEGTEIDPENPEASFATPLVTTTSSLAVVLGLFAVLVWASKKYGPKSAGGSLPGELIENLGSMAIDPRTKIVLLRISNRIVVASQTASGLASLSEIEDVDEVNKILAMCNRQSRADFSGVLKSLENEPIQRGFAEPPPAVSKPSPRRLFATA